MNIETIVPVLIAFFIITVSPGPANIAVATVAMSSGRRSGLLFGLGLAVGLAFWGVIAATGLGVILQASEYALIALKVFGGCYLLWLAYQSAMCAARPTNQTKQVTKQGKWFYRGLLLNLSNPKAVVAWMAALSMGLSSGESLSQVAVVTLVCMLIGILNYSAHAFAFSYSGVRTTYQRFGRWVDGVVAGLFAVAGFSLLRSAVYR